jgi:2-polyprenyl-3-methyl-5-hydroxy-6-metoxy-1,4-benzoquinol methylase
LSLDARRIVQRVVEISGLKKNSSAPSVVKSEFAKRVDYWEDIYGDGESFDLDANVRMSIAFESMANRESDQQSVLDIGCGAGNYLVELSRMGVKDLVGVDITPEMIERAKQVWAKSRSGQSEPEFVVADFESVTELLTGKKFDVIFCMGVIEYVPDDSRALGVMQALLKPGGTLVISAPNRLPTTIVGMMSATKGAWNRVMPTALKMSNAARYTRKRYSVSGFRDVAHGSSLDVEWWAGHGYSQVSFLHKFRIIKRFDDALNRFMHRVGRLSISRWLQRSASDYVFALRSSR